MHGPAVHFLVSAGYAALALWFWNTRWRAAPAAEGLSLAERLAVLVPLA